MLAEVGLYACPGVAVWSTITIVCFFFFCLDVCIIKYNCSHCGSLGSAERNLKCLFNSLCLLAWCAGFGTWSQ